MSVIYIINSLKQIISVFVIFCFLKEMFKYHYSGNLLTNNFNIEILYL